MNKYDPLGVIDNYAALAYCILSPEYICPEKAFAMYLSNSGYTNNTSIKWFDEALEKELLYMKDKFNYKELQELYGMTESNLYKRISKAKKKYMAVVKK